MKEKNRMDKIEEKAAEPTSAINDPDHEPFSGYVPGTDRTVALPPFVVLCRRCPNMVIERDTLRDAQHAVKLHKEAQDHTAHVYGLAILP